MESKNFIESIGNTPLIYIRSLSELTGAKVYGKAEFLNPGGSVKDRPALYMIEDAEKRGLLKKGGLIIEATSGNTGIGLALIANVKGYRMKIYIPSNQSKEKIDTLRALGAEVELIAPAPYPDPKNYRIIAREDALKSGAYFINQFENPSNYQAHYETTGPEVYLQTEGKISGFTCAVGSGGTLAGVSKYLKEKNPKVRVSCVDPYGSAMYNYFKNGEAVLTPGETVTEGISQSAVTANVKPCQVDEAFSLDDEVIHNMVHFIIKEEGLFLGSSSGTNLCGAYLMAKRLGPGSTVVTILCDSGQKYVSKTFNPDFMKERGLKITGQAKDIFPKLDALL